MPLDALGFAQRTRIPRSPLVEVAKPWFRDLFVDLSETAKPWVRDFFSEKAKLSPAVLYL
jgi:hypothetical protein